MSHRNRVFEATRQKLQEERGTPVSAEEVQRHLKQQKKATKLPPPIRKSAKARMSTLAFR